MSTHSPHPWRLIAHRSPARIESSTGGPALALVYLTSPETRRRMPTFEKNARLMQHAPAMYEMIRRLCEVLQDNMDRDDPVPYCVKDAERLLHEIDRPRDYTV